MSEPVATNGSSPAAPLPTTRVNWPVLIVSAAVILAISILAIVAPTGTETVIFGIVGWVSGNFGWYYVLTATLIVGFVIYLAASRAGGIRLGPDHSRPAFNLFTWTAMLFAAGIGIDLMFFSVAEPVTQYIQPPTAYDGTGAQPETIAAARQAVVWTLFHYGITGWAMYALLGVGFAYFAYRKGWPLSIRSMLRPLFGKRLDGWLGHSVDIAAVLGAVFGIATSLGIGVVQLNYGLFLMFGVPEGVGAQVGLIVLSVIMATISTVSGVEKGIRRLSELNVIMAVILLAYVLIMDKTQFLMNAMVMNIGDFIARYPAMMLETFAFEQAEFAGFGLPYGAEFMTGWMGDWTLFFWAWWIAWAPFVGLFLARISRGRTIRQFVTGVLVVPFMFILIFISIFGNAALGLVAGGDAAFGEVAVNTPERAFYSLLEAYPAAPLVIGVATLVGLLFYVTSADSGALVLANFTSIIPDAKHDGDTRLRVFWSVTTGLLTLGMLIVGGVGTLQGATLIIGLPFSLVMYLVMFSLYRALRQEVHNEDGYRATLPNSIGATTGKEFSWRQRLRRATGFPSQTMAAKYMSETAVPALQEVAAEFVESGAEVTVDVFEVADVGVPQVELHVELPNAESFLYQVWPVSGQTPSFAFKVASDTDRYFRLEVFTANGSRGYDVYGYTSEQLIADVIAHYESHLEYLRLAKQAPVIDADEHTTMNWQDDFSSKD